MSVGHAHARANDKHPAELRKLLAEPTAAAMLKTPPALRTDKDIPDTGGYPVIGNWRYLDSFFVTSVKAGGFLDAGKWVPIAVPKMTADQIIHATWMHEFIEKVILDADNDVETYQDAHEFATCAEHDYIRSIGASPYLYERALEPLIKFIEARPLANPPLDLDCEPYLDRPDAQDKVTLRQFRRLGVADASKAPKESVGYSRSTGADRCGGCEHWQAGRPAGQPVDLAPCDLVAGAVRRTWWCTKFQAMEGTNDQAQQISPGIQGGGSQGSQGTGDPQSGSGGGGSGPQGVPGGAQGQPAA